MTGTAGAEVRLARAEDLAAASRNRKIADAAVQLGVAAGLAVHQLHQKRLLDYRYGNRLCVDLASAVSA